MTDKTRIIKKYPNRRLYDMAESRYITLEEIKTLVLNHVNFKVIDTHTKNDVTNYILLQVITEAEGGQYPILTTEVLLNMIRFYGNPLQKNMSQFLEQSFLLFNKQIQDIENKNNPLAQMSELMLQNVGAWQSMMENYFNTFKTSSKQKE